MRIEHMQNHAAELSAQIFFGVQPFVMLLLQAL